MVSQSGVTEPWTILHGSTFYNLKEFAEIIDFAEGRDFHFLTHLGARTVTAPNGLRQLEALTDARANRARDDVAVKKDQQTEVRPHSGSMPAAMPGHPDAKTAVVKGVSGNGGEATGAIGTAPMIAGRGGGEHHGA